jgi:hypothetical protein
MLHFKGFLASRVIVTPKEALLSLCPEIDFPQIQITEFMSPQSTSE